MHPLFARAVWREKRRVASKAVGRPAFGCALQVKRKRKKSLSRGVWPSDRGEIFVVHVFDPMNYACDSIITGHIALKSSRARLISWGGEGAPRTPFPKTNAPNAPRPRRAAGRGAQRRARQAYATRLGARRRSAGQGASEEAGPTAERSRGEKEEEGAAAPRRPSCSWRLVRRARPRAPTPGAWLEGRAGRPRRQAGGGERRRPELPPSIRVHPRRRARPRLCSGSWRPARMGALPSCFAAGERELFAREEGRNEQKIADDNEPSNIVHRSAR